MKNNYSALPHRRDASTNVYAASSLEFVSSFKLNKICPSSRQRYDAITFRDMLLLPRAHVVIVIVGNQITELEQTKTNLERRVAELRGKLEIIEKRDAERRAADERRKKEELDFLKYQGQHLDSFLKQMNASK